MDPNDFLPHPAPTSYAGTVYFYNDFVYLQYPAGPADPTTWTVLQQDPTLACVANLAAARATADSLSGRFRSGAGAEFQGVRYDAYGQNPAWLFWNGVR